MGCGSSRKPPVIEEPEPESEPGSPEATPRSAAKSKSKSRSRSPSPARRRSPERPASNESGIFSAWSQKIEEGQFLPWDGIKRPPGADGKLRAKARAAYEAEQWEKSAQLYTKLTALVGEEFEAQFCLGVIRTLQAQYDKGRTHLMKALELRSDSFETHSVLLFNMHQSQSASNLEPAIQLSETFANIAVSLRRSAKSGMKRAAWAYVEADRIPEIKDLITFLADASRENYADVLKAIDGLEYEWLRRQVDEERAKGEEMNARRVLAMLHRMVELEPDDLDAVMDMGDLCMEQGWIDEALAQYNVVVRAVPDHAQANKGLLEANLELDRPADAIAVMRKYVAATSAPESHSALPLLVDGAWAFEEVHDVEALREMTNEVKRVYPQDAREATEYFGRIQASQVKYFNTQGTEELRAGRIDAAQTAFQRTLEIDERDFDAALTMGNIKTRLTELPAGEDYYRRAIKAAEKDSRPQYALLENMKLQKDPHRLMSAAVDFNTFCMNVGTVSPLDGLRGCAIAFVEEEQIDLMKGLVEMAKASYDTAALTALSVDVETTCLKTQGARLVDADKLPEARERFARVLELHPTDTEAKFWLAVIASTSDDLSKAQVYLQQTMVDTDGMAKYLRKLRENKSPEKVLYWTQQLRKIHDHISMTRL